MHHQAFRDLQLDLAWIDTVIFDNIAQHIDLRQLEQLPAGNVYANEGRFLVWEGFVRAFSIAK